MQVAILVTKEVAVVIGEANVVPISVLNTASLREAHRQQTKTWESALKQLSFTWNAADKYAKLISFEMEVTIQTKMYKLTKEQKVPMIKNWLVQ